VVKRAYLDRALRFHPDRQGDESADTRQRAEFRMREINDAWAVLRNPATRARYDDELAAAAPERPSAGPSSGRSSADRPGVSSSGVTATDVRLGAVLREPEVADLQRDDGRVAVRRRSSSWRMWAPIIIGGVVLLTVVVFTAYAQSDEPPLRVQTVEEFAVGTCVVVGFGPSQANPNAGEQARELVVTIPCNQPGARRVMGRVPFPKPCPNGSVPHLLPSGEEALCLQ
jgi:plasmid stabilization system protein ParE